MSGKSSQFLVDKLPEDFLLIPNVTLAYQDHDSGNVSDLEYDLIVVAPHAIYHLETKDWIGRLEGNDSMWYLNGREKGRPMRTAGFKTRILVSNLKEKDATWGKAWVDTAIVFCGSKIQFFNVDGNYGNRIFQLDRGLLGYLEKFHKQGPTTERSPTFNTASPTILLVAAKTRKKHGSWIMKFWKSSINMKAIRNTSAVPLGRRRRQKSVSGNIH